MIKGSFYEFNVARSALFTAQANLQVTGHNIANAATPGYSRQYGVTVTNDPMRGNGTGMYGTGSRVTTVERIRSQFLDEKYWNQNTVLAEYTTKKTYMEQLERTFITSGPDGIQNTILEQMQELESVFSDLATNANDLTFRNNVISSAGALTTIIGQIGNNLTQQQQTVNQEIVLVVNKMNTIADSIARLSKQIQSAEFRGDTANDLRDQRELLIDELSGYANVTVQERQTNPDYNENDPYSSAPNYEMTILIDGQLFVKGDYVNKLELVNRDEYTPPVKKNPTDGPGLYDIRFAGSETNLNMYSSTLKGSLKGLIDMRDGNNSRGLTLQSNPPLQDANGEFYAENDYGDEFYRTTSFKGIPHYLDRINELCRTFAQAMNEGLDHDGNPMEGVVGHVNGYDLGGNTGRFFYTMYDDEGNEITNIYDDSVAILNETTGVMEYKKYVDLTADEKASLYENIDWNSFNLSSELQNDPSLLATSSVYGTGESDNKVSLGFSSLMDDPNLFAAGKLTDYIIGITTEAAISAKQVNKFEESYSDIVVLADNQRLSVMGVDVDEEGVNMVKYQQMYQAAAKMITIMDSIYDITINQLF